MARSWQKALASRRGSAELLALAACLVLALGCSGSGDDDDGSGAAPCGAPAGDWTYLFSCDSTGLGVHQCTDYYATKSAAGAVRQSFQSVCGAFSGTIQNKTCSAAGSVGSCVDTASSGPAASSSQAVLTQLYEYDSDSSYAATYAADCQRNGGVYVAADGSAPSLPAGTNAAACKKSSSGASGGNVFSVATYLNDEVLECTNYVGHVTAQELDAVITADGAVAEACPEANALCSCPQATGSGPYGTTATLVYYKTSIDPNGSCPNTDAACTAGYRAP